MYDDLSRIERCYGSVAEYNRSRSDMRRLEVVDYCEVIEITERKDGKSLYGLHFVY